MGPENRTNINLMRRAEKHRTKNEAHGRGQIELCIVRAICGSERRSFRLEVVSLSFPPRPTTTVSRRMHVKHPLWRSLHFTSPRLVSFRRPKTGLGHPGRSRGTPARAHHAYVIGALIADFSGKIGYKFSYMTA